MACRERWNREINFELNCLPGYFKTTTPLVINTSLLFMTQVKKHIYSQSNNLFIDNYTSSVGSPNSISIVAMILLLY